MDSIVLRSPLDMHLHVRDGEMLRLVAPLTAESFVGAVIMPNLVPPVTSVEDVTAYEARIRAAVGDRVFKPYMTTFFRAYGEKELKALKPHILGIKLYPEGATTNSEGGVRSMEAILPTLEIMEALDIPLMVHGESHGFVMDREKEFLDVYRLLARSFPKLRITMEHITTATAVGLLDEFPNLYATVTLQHLLITLDDVVGGLMNPHLFCKPLAKRPEDRESLLRAALSAHPKLMFGSDSAPHPKHKKECCGCAAGVFSAPMALPCLAQLFDDHDALESLQAFVSDNACEVYRLTPPVKEVRLGCGNFEIPPSYQGFGEEVIPMFAGKSLEWALL